MRKHGICYLFDDESAISLTFTEEYSSPRIKGKSGSLTQGTGLSC